jgi:hypothetical protein
MKKNGWLKIAGFCFTISLVVGMIGGALTNEYLISYLFGQLSDKQQEELPIVKKVIEERVYVEESLTIEAIQEARPAVASIYATRQSAESVSENVKGVNGIVLTTDGVVVSCSNQLAGQNTWYVSIKDKDVVPARVISRNNTFGLTYLQLDSKGEFYQTISLAKENLKLGQNAIALTKDTIKSALVSKVAPKDFHMVDRMLGDDFKCSPIINLGGELIGLASVQNENSDVTLIIPAQILEELLVKEVAL